MYLIFTEIFKIFNQKIREIINLWENVDEGLVCTTDIIFVSIEIHFKEDAILLFFNFLLTKVLLSIKIIM